MKKDTISIPRKVFYGIAPAIAIAAILIAKGNAGALVLFIVGIGTGVLIGKGFFEGKK